MHRFFLPPGLFNSEEVILPPEVSHQVHRVLRLKVDTPVVLLDGTGYAYTSVLRTIGESCIASIKTKELVQGEPQTRLRLILALTQREKFEWMLQKCTEVGVSEFLPVITSRTLIQKARDVEDKYPRWQKILREAAEQSHRGLIPALLPVTVFAQAVKQYNDALKLILWEDESKTGLKDLLHGYKGNSLTLVVGPEGGLSREEVDLASQNGFTPVTLGKRILRMETAAILAAGLALYDLG
jgi:16S rRNA (uracil1498-N3)-methyltransferase